MTKKLFLFTLLVSSFLVISCNNKDKTGTDASAGIDASYAGTYNGTISSPLVPNEKYQTTLTVNADGSAVIDATDIEINQDQIAKSYIQNNGDGEYTYSSTDENSDYSGTIIFKFNGSSSVDITITIDNSDGQLILTGTLTVQQ